MKNFSLVLALVFAGIFGSVFAPSAQAQGGAGFDYKAQDVVVSDFGKWVAHSSTAIASGARTITIENPWLQTAAGWGSVNPFFATNTLLIQSESASVSETITITSSSCTSPTLCTVTATFTYAHSGRYTIKSGSYGVNEAIKQVLGMGGGQVIVPANFGGTTGMITGAVGSSSVFVVDQRAGKNDTYGWSGAAYAALLSMTPTTISVTSGSYNVPGLLGVVSPAATLTAKTGTSPALLTLSNDSTPNFNTGNVAIGANTAAATIAGFKTRDTGATGAATTTIVTGDDLFSISAYGADGTNYIKTGAILFDSTGTIAATRVPSVIKFQTGTDASPTVLTTALTLGADQTATFAAGLTGTTGVFATSVASPSVFNTAGALALATVTSGNITLNPAAAATAAVTTNTRFETAKGTTVVSGSCSSGDCTLPGDGVAFLLSGTTAVDGFATAGWQSGSIIYLTFDGNLTLNDSGTVAAGYGALKLVGGANVSATANDWVQLMFTGTNWEQIAPTLVK